MNYSDKLKDERWINLSNHMKKYYDFRCCGCGSNNDLNTHHLIYRKGLEPWEYSFSDLTVLCNSCHGTFHNNELRLKEVLKDGRLMYGYEFDYIIKIIDKMAKLDTNDYRKVFDFVSELEDNSCNF